MGSGRRPPVNLIMMFVLCWLAAASASADPGAPPRAPIATMDTRIIAGCVLNIVVKDEAELSHTYTVDTGGLVHFTIEDSSGSRKVEWSVAVAGKTTDAARAAITDSLNTYIKSPEVHVTIVRVPGLHVQIEGEVVRGGGYVLPFNSRLSDLFGIALARNSADLTNVLIRRGASSSAPAAQPRTFVVDFTSTTGADDADDPLLEDGDKIYLRKLAQQAVPPELQVVRIIGEINNPGREVVNGAVQTADGVALPLAKEMTVKELFERVGGLKETADRAHLYLGRLDGTTRVLNADRVESGDSDENLKLRPGDLIIVPRRDRSEVFAVLGEVNAPNTFPLRPGEKVRVLDAIMRAGDLSKKADIHRAILSKAYLLDPTRARQIPFDPELMKKGQQPNMEIEPGDAVIIEQRRKRPTFWQQLLPLALHFLPF